MENGAHFRQVSTNPTCYLPIGYEAQQSQPDDGRAQDATASRAPGFFFL